MKTIIAWSKYAAVAFYDGYTRFFDGARPHFLLVLGHMRSGSSLLHHLLVEHPDLDGEGEQNRPYTDRRDLAWWQLRYRKQCWLWRPGVRYLVDQVNHNYLTPQPELLTRATVKVIFLVREPGPSVASMLRLSAQYYNGHWTLEQTRAHYEERYTYLGDLSVRIASGRGLLLTYRDLTEYSEDCLAAVQRFLGLKKPFTVNYRQREFTGRRGDPAGRISTGYILPAREAVAKVHYPTTEKLENSYRNCFDQLQHLYWKNQLDEV